METRARCGFFFVNLVPASQYEPRLLGGAQEHEAIEHPRSANDWAWQQTRCRTLNPVSSQFNTPGECLLQLEQLSMTSSLFSARRAATSQAAERADRREKPTAKAPGGVQPSHGAHMVYAVSETTVILKSAPDWASTASGCRRPSVPDTVRVAMASRSA